MKDNKKDKSNKKEKQLDLAKVCLGVSCLIVFSPMLFPSATLSSITGVTTVITKVGVIALSGFSAFAILDVSKNIVTKNKEVK